MKLAFVAQDDLSTVIFAGWYARRFRDRADIEFYTISSVGTHHDELMSLGTKYIAIDGYRFIHPYKDLLYFLRLLHILRRERFDLVVTFGTKPNIYAALAARVARVPHIVVAVRGLGRVFAGAGGLADRVLRSVVRLLYRQACRGANRVWFTNRGDLKYFVESGIVDQSKTFLTTNSVSLEYFSMDRVDPAVLDATRRQLGIAPDDFVVIMVARRVWSKGVREFVEASRALQHRAGMKFVMLAPSEGTSADAVPESYVQEARALPNLIWLDFRKDVREMYALADLAVLPSYYKEGGYPRALLEPMALGKPVIAADTDDCRGPVENLGNGYLVPPGDAAALAGRIDDLYLDRGKGRCFGARSLEIMRSRFDDEIVGRQVLAELGIGA